MNLHSLKIQGFRRIKESEIRFGDATFLIGPNNSGKSSILKSIELLLSGRKQAPAEDFFSEIDPDTGEQSITIRTIVLEGEFRNVPDEARDWRGFKGRVLEYEPHGEGDSGNRIIFRKTYNIGEDLKFEMLQKKRKLKPEFEKAKNFKDFLDSGLDVEILFGNGIDLEKKFTAKDKLLMEEINELWDFEDEEEWFNNPGGLLGVVISRLPDYLHIPAEPHSREIDEKSGALTDTLSALFKLVRDSSNNYKEAQKYLNDLAKELDPSDKNSEFGKMMDGLNEVLDGVFPETKIHATADLTDPNSSLKPSFDITMQSNIRTKVNYQGTGLIRSAIFALLRYRHRWESQQGGATLRGLIIGFEEPEIYLHPSAANQMRDTIYDLSESTSQIVATTHSPYLIDISKKPRQVLNRLHPGKDGVSIKPFSVSDEFIKLQDKDKSYVKMLLKIDDHISRIFFTRQVIVVEGDTEDIAIRRFLELIRNTDRLKYLLIKRDFEVVKARGKGAIIGLANYLNALEVDYLVIHDKDEGTAGAEKMNTPIQDAVGDSKRVIVLENCVEDVLGYAAPSSEKPYRAYRESEKWIDNMDAVPNEFKITMEKVFGDYLK